MEQKEGRGRGREQQFHKRNIEKSTSLRPFAPSLSLSLSLSLFLSLAISFFFFVSP
jgi:hypothetical protein